MDFKEQHRADWELIASYLSGEMNEEEQGLFDQRISSSESNKIYFEQVKSDWRIMENLKEEQEFNTDKAWGNLFEKLEQDGLIEQKKKKRSFNLLNISKIAAVLVLGIVVGYLTYNSLKSNTGSNFLVISTYETGTIQVVELPDGSVVHLNANSKIYYPEKFDGKMRNVEFEGDGFFDIAKNPQKPFIIKAKDAEITVLGTSFNVNTKGKSKVEVLVETGKVKLNDLNNKEEEVDLEPGYLGTLENKKISKKKNSDKNYMAWKTREFNFEGVEFAKIIEVINRTYNVNIEYNKSEINRNVTLNTSNANQTIDEFIEIMCEALQLTSTKEGNTIVLKKK